MGKGNPFAVGCKLVPPLWKSTTLLYGICPKDSISRSTDTCSAMFTDALFGICKQWKQPKCPSVDEWRMKMQYIDSMEYYPEVKKMRSGTLQVNG